MIFNQFVCRKSSSILVANSDALFTRRAHSVVKSAVSHSMCVRNEWDEGSWIKWIKINEYLTMSSVVYINRAIEGVMETDAFHRTHTEIDFFVIRCWFEHDMKGISPNAKLPRGKKGIGSPEEKYIIGEVGLRFC